MSFYANCPPLFTLNPVSNHRQDAGAARCSLIIILEEAKSNATRSICLFSFAGTSAGTAKEPFGFNLVWLKSDFGCQSERSFSQTSSQTKTEVLI